MSTGSINYQHENNHLELGIGLISWILLGSLWATVGFIAEFTAINLGVPTTFADIAFLAIGSISVAACIIWFWQRISSNRHLQRDALIGGAIYLCLLILTPRSFTYDTGLYHLPVINHLSKIGLEWNLGWLHTRYGFFNLLLYGQASLSRMIGSLAVPSLNGGVLVSMILVFSNQIRRDWTKLIPCMAVTGAALIPSEATESFHSFNADFALGCIFVTCCCIASEENSRRRHLTRLCIITLMMPAIKLSGLLLIPIVAATYFSNSLLKTAPIDWFKLLAITLTAAVAVGSFGYIASGYLAYPVSATGPLRQDAIPKSEVINESKGSTTAWARFAYSDNIDSLKVDADLSDWFPKWSYSLNGKRMLTHLLLTSLLALSSLFHQRLRVWKLTLLVLFCFWMLAIFILPPDPRFYFGPVLLNLYLATRLLLQPDIFTPRKRSVHVHVFIVAIFCIICFTSVWRKSQFALGKFPQAEGISSGQLEKGLYKSKSQRTIIQSKGSSCWALPPPCIP